MLAPEPHVEPPADREPTYAIPTALRVHLAHATVEALARSVGADLLHVKGPAVDASLRGPRTDDSTGQRDAAPRLSTDADVLVRPEHVAAMMDGLVAHGWAIVTRFQSGSVFEHAATLWHDDLGYVDVHRAFPGIERPPADAFALLWAGRHEVSIAHHPCAVPDVEMQRLILLLHAARGGGLSHPDAALLWTNGSDDDRARMLALASELDAEVALAAATGRLDEFASRPTAPLWRIFERGGTPTRLDEWRARFRASSGFWPRVRLAGRALLVNTDHLAMRLGRPVTRQEVALEYARRVRTGALEVAGLVRRKVGRHP